ncbi:MAG: pentapeptide repeat-containing protein, partial [bacterium]
NGLDLHGTDFSKTHLYSTSFIGANLESANFSNAKASIVKFQKSNLKNANFQRASILLGNFYLANITGADFRFANIKESEFEYTDRENVNWDFAMMCKTRFTRRQSKNTKRFLETFHGLVNFNCVSRGSPVSICCKSNPPKKFQTKMDILIDKWKDAYSICRGGKEGNRERSCDKVLLFATQLRKMNLCEGRYSWYNMRGKGAFMLTRNTWIPCRYKRLVDD